MAGISSDAATWVTSDGPDSQPSQAQTNASISTDLRNTDAEVAPQSPVDDMGEELDVIPMDIDNAGDDTDAQLAAQITAQEMAGYDSGNDQDAPPAQAERLECLCGDQLTEAVEYIWLTCGHARCIDCVNTMVKVGLEKRGSFPPRCCRKTFGINLEEVVPFLDDVQVLRWFAVAEEYADEKPMYCGESACSKYLSKATTTDDGEWRLCEDCGGSTCTGCGALSTAHENLDECPERLAKIDKEFMEGKGWKPCANCNHMIERIDGCDHMTCENCHHEFCYGCGRSYGGGLPCNCHGQNPWVEGDPDAHDMVVQQALDTIANQLGPGHRLGGAANEPDDAAEDETEDESGDEEDIEIAQGVQAPLNEAADDSLPAAQMPTDHGVSATNLPNFEEGGNENRLPAINASTDRVLDADQVRLPGIQHVLGEEYSAFEATRAHWADRLHPPGT